MDQAAIEAAFQKCLLTEKNTAGVDGWREFDDVFPQLSQQDGLKMHLKLHSNSDVFVVNQLEFKPGI